MAEIFSALKRAQLIKYLEAQPTGLSVPDVIEFFHNCEVVEEMPEKAENVEKPPRKDGEDDEGSDEE